MLRWPDDEEVIESLKKWAATEGTRHPQLVRLGYFGSYARGDAGVGSDLNLVAVVEEHSAPFERRALEWNLSGLPVPAEILIYTQKEWDTLLADGGRFARVMREETVWLGGTAPR